MQPTIKAKPRRSVVLWGAAALLAVVAVLGGYSLFFVEVSPSTPDISKWSWSELDEGRISMLLPVEGIADGADGFGTPDGILPYIRLLRLDAVPLPADDAVLEERMTTLLLEIVAGEKVVSEPSFYRNEEDTAILQTLTMPQTGLLSSTRLFVSEGELYCAYITIPSEPDDPASQELFETFFDSISVSPR